MLRGILGAVIAIGLAAIVAVAPQLSSAQTAASTWPTFHADGVRDGVAPVRGPVGSVTATTYSLPTPIPTSSPFISSPVVDAAGNAYVGSENGNVYALSPTLTNPIKWTFKTGGPVVSTPTLSADGSTLFVGSNDGNVYAIKTSNGSQLWQRSLGSAVRASPLLSPDGKTIFVPAINGTLDALATADGSVTWTFQSPVGAITGSVATDGFNLFFVTSTFLYSLPMAGPGTSGPSAGYLDGAGVSTPAINPNGNIYVGTVTGRMDCFTGALSPCPGWPFQVQGSPAITSTPAFLAGQVIFGAGNSIYAVDQSTGKVSWTATTGGGINSSPAVASGNSMVYVGSADGKLYALSVPSTGTPTVAFARSMNGPVDSSPALASDGSLWVADRTGSVLQLSPVTPTSTPTATATATATSITTPTPTTAPATATPTNTPTATPSPTPSPTPVPPLVYSVVATKVEWASSAFDYALKHSSIARVPVGQKVRLTTYLQVNGMTDLIPIQEATRVTLKGKTVFYQRTDAYLASAVSGSQGAFWSFFTPKSAGTYRVTGTVFVNGHHKHAVSTFTAVRH
jgi:outer membrane protein assembly factor BamB